MYCRLRRILSNEGLLSRIPRRLYHYSEDLFKRFDLSKSSRSAIWGPGIYLSDDPRGLSGWGKSRSKEGYLYEVELRTNPNRIIDATQPTTDHVYEAIESKIGRPLSDLTRESGMFPFLTIERKFGTVAEALKELGFDVFIHEPPGSHPGKHYLVTNPRALKILRVGR